MKVWLITLQKVYVRPAGTLCHAEQKAPVVHNLKNNFFCWPQTFRTNSPRIGYPGKVSNFYGELDSSIHIYFGQWIAGKFPIFRSYPGKLSIENSYRFYAVKNCFYENNLLNFGPGSSVKLRLLWQVCSFSMILYSKSYRN